MIPRFWTCLRSVATLLVVAAGAGGDSSVAETESTAILFGNRTV